jgi:hypothetical protein
MYLINQTRFERFFFRNPGQTFWTNWRKQAEQNLSIAALAPEIRIGAILAMIFYEILNLVNFRQPQLLLSYD